MKQYFDLFVYVTNWGTHELMLRLPHRLLSLTAATPYRQAESLRVSTTRDHVILDFYSEDEAAADIEDDDDGWLSALLPLRAELASGDLSALYLGWLAGAQALELDDEALEPEVPAGLREPSVALQVLASFLRLDRELFDVAAEASPALAPRLTRQAIEAWVHGLANAEKTGVVIRLLTDEDPHYLKAELVQRVRRERESDRDQSNRAVAHPRTVGQLLAAAAQRRDARKRAASERAERQRRRQERQAAMDRAAYLDGLATRVEEEWPRVQTLVASKRQADYDTAVRVLRDLHDLAVRDGRLDGFVARLGRFRSIHARKVSLIERLDRAQLASERTALPDATPLQE